MREKDIESLQHTTWRRRYHVVFAPKYRRMVIYGQIKKDIGRILRALCEQKGVGIIEAQACPDHIHMLLSIPLKYSVTNYGVSQREKQPDDFRQTCQSKIQVWRQAFLGKGILRRYGRAKQKADTGIHQKAAGGRPDCRPDESERVY